MWKKFVRDYLTFSKKERFAVLLLVGLFAIITAIPYLLPAPAESSVTGQHQQLLQDFQELFETSAGVSKENINISDERLTANNNFSGSPVLFYFDPNLISEDQWIQLGVEGRTAATIKKYLSKGGRFRKPEDLLKIYTLNKEIAKKLIPFVRIGEKQNQAYSFSSDIRTADDPGPDNTEAVRYETKQYREVDINLADTSAFKIFPGIGSRLASRIVAYRESLGGFISVEQVGEVRFLPDTTFRKISPFLRLSDTEIRKININTAKLEELVRHPYFDFAIARSIIRYRDQHGGFKDTAELNAIHVISEKQFKKVIPYLVVE